MIGLPIRRTLFTFPSDELQGYGIYHCYFVPGIFVDKSNLFLLQLPKNIEMYAFLVSHMITCSYVLDAVRSRRVLRSCSRMSYL